MHVSKEPYIVSCDLDALLRGMRKRYSSKPMDKICAIAFPFMKCNYARKPYMTLPIYDSNTPTSVAWENLISSLASTAMEFDEWAVHVYFYIKHGFLESLGLPYTATAQLLCLFPHPSKHHWFPSWTQVQQYPDVSVRDSDPSQTVSGMDYSLRIMFGRIYRGCSLQLIKPPTPETEAIYCSTMDGKDAQLVATVPGIELHIDSRIEYVLVDISPDPSLWPDNGVHTCRDTDEGHEHQPIWPKSVIIVCEEVDTLALECPSAVMKYRLRRVTTLEWECRQPDKPNGCWLPFEPSLVHMRAIVCSAKDRKFVKSLDNEDTDSEDSEETDSEDNEAIDSRDNEVIDSRDNEVIDSRDNEAIDSRYNEAIDSSDNEGIDLDVFCDPVAIASLSSQGGWHEDWPQGWHSRWPRYQVYVM